MKTELLVLQAQCTKNDSMGAEQFILVSSFEIYDMSNFCFVTVVLFLYYQDWHSCSSRRAV